MKMDMIYLKLLFLKKIKKILFPDVLSSFFNLFIFSIIIYSLLRGSIWFLNNSNWDVVTSNLSLFAYGRYPFNQQWRPFIWIITLLILIILTIWNPNWKILKQNLLLLWISTVPLGIFLLYGGFGVPIVMSNHWGGLTLTILLTVCTILVSLPLGIILGFCRQSSFPLIKNISALYIDVMRSVPLITVLFFGQLLIPLFLPMGIEIDRVWRAILAFSLFLSAYIAEDIRGGLQSIPKTQIEASKSLGLNQYQVIRYILTPQAIRISLPALTNQSIGLFQNTSLMSILGLVELLGVGRSILANPEFIGQYMEVYIWLASVYWIFCTLMAMISRKLEQSLKIKKNSFY